MHTHTHTHSHGHSRVHKQTHNTRTHQNNNVHTHQQTRTHQNKHVHIYKETHTSTYLNQQTKVNILRLGFTSLHFPVMFMRNILPLQSNPPLLYIVRSLLNLCIACKPSQHGVCDGYSLIYEGRKHTMAAAGLKEDEEDCG